MRRVIAPVIVLALLVAGCTSSEKSSPKTSQLRDVSGSAGFEGVGVDPAQPRPSFTLTDTSGKRFSFGQRTAGAPTLLYFGYTNCPDVCPATMFDMSAAVRSLPRAIQEKTYIVFVSTDVKRDTAPVIKKWLSYFNGNIYAHFVGLRGTQAEIDAAQAAAHIQLAEDDGQTHSAQVLLFGKDNYARVTYLQSTNEQEQIAHDLPKVA